MAPVSKTSHFDIYDDHDANLQTPDSTYHSSFDETVVKHGLVDGGDNARSLGVGDGFVTESEEDVEGGEGDDEDGKYKRRVVSNITRTSISSMPDSTYPTDHERAFAQMHSPYTRSRLRPNLRRANMTTPSPFGTHSPRDIGLRGCRSKDNTPRSGVRGSAKARREEAKSFPLVLLHFTLLPISLPWPTDVMRELLPQRVLKSIQLLRSKASETLLSRGILIPHPEDDYELLEERLLEALELQEGRITKCGHFRGRSSTSSASILMSEDGDSGLGSGDEGMDKDVCSTCEHPVEASSSNRKRWSVRVYAANGLMRANAWAAAWSEMERVDVEIVPWISDDLRISLDETVAEREVQRQHETGTYSGLTPDFISKDDYPAAPSEEDLNAESGSRYSAPPSLKQMPAKPLQDLSSQPALPAIYKPKDIPLSILLRNCFLLLLQDRKIVAGFFLGLIGLFFAMQPASSSILHPNLFSLGTRSIDVPHADIVAAEGSNFSRDGVKFQVAEVMQAEPVAASRDVIPTAASNKEVAALVPDVIFGYIDSARSHASTVMVTTAQTVNFHGSEDILQICVAEITG